jgi:excisionase family DNA binding protein
VKDRNHLSADDIAQDLGVSRPEPEVLTVDEAAKLLRLNRKTVYSMVDKRQLPGARRFRGAIRIHKPTLVAWMAAGAPR